MDGNKHDAIIKNKEHARLKQDRMPRRSVAEKATKTSEFNKNILQLQKQLAKSKAEAEMLKDKLNCVISLVKRSWKGDRNASIHLANIVGMEIPAGLMDGTEGYPVSVELLSPKSAALQNWERLSSKLLKQEHTALQHEIQERQYQHLKIRSQFMDEVMTNHYRDMSHMNLRQPRSWTLEEMDRHFLLKHNKMKEALIHPVVRTLQRGRSASVTHQKLCQDIVKQGNLKLQDFFLGSSCLATQDNNAAKDTTFHASRKSVPEKENTQKLAHQQNDEIYYDSKWYLKKNLFNADKIVTRKPRPISAAHLREKDNIRAQPRSAGFARTNTQAFVTQEGERSLGNKTMGQASATGIKKTPATDISNNCQDQDDPNTGITPPSPVRVIVESDFEDETTFPTITTQANNALHLPQSVEMLSNDLKKMEEMERLFTNSTFSLQGKLGFT